MNVVLAGGTGFIGKALVEELARQNHRIILLTRRPGKTKNPSVTEVEWDGKTPGPWTAFVDGADAIINLCGESIAAKPWTAAQKQKILSSRIEPIRALSQAISSAQKKPPVLVQASGAGFYGDRGDELITETAEHGKGFLADTCVRWEGSAKSIELAGVRVVYIRLGVVLAPNASILSKMRLPFQMFMGGPLGSGKQWLPWIHLDDAARLLIHAMNTTELQGPVNAAAPETTTMETFCKTFGDLIARPSWLKVPAPLLKIALGQMSELMLNSERVVPAKLMRSGFQFKYPHLRAALEASL